MIYILFSVSLLGLTSSYTSLCSDRLIRYNVDNLKLKIILNQVLIQLVKII